MSVFTPLQEEEVQQFLAGYDVGEVITYQGIQGGSENTNFFIDTLDGNNQRRWVLTLIERGPVDELSFFVDLLEVLHDKGLSVPYALADRHNQRIQHIKERPALLQPCLTGKHPEIASAELCRSLGRWLAHMHAATEHSSLSRQSDRHPEWVVANAGALLGTQWQSHASWLGSALQDLETWLQAPPALPVSIIHGDLFRDNALVKDDEINGVIDFYNAYRGWTLMDIAICVNDWCVEFDEAGQPEIQRDRLLALITGYQSVRTLSQTEASHWLTILQLAALRFWVSRQLAWVKAGKQQAITVKDPDPFARLFQYYRHHQLTNTQELNW